MGATQSKRGLDSLSGGLFLIGLGVLFLVPGVGVWPWILVVIGAAQLPVNLARQRGWMAWQGFFWLTGLAILFATGWFWPGILILLGLNMLVGAMTKGTPGSPFANKGPEAPSVERSEWLEPGEAQAEERPTATLLTPAEDDQSAPQTAQSAPRPTQEL